MGFISNTICGYNTRKTIRSSSLSLVNKFRSSLSLSPSLSSSYHHHHHRHRHHSSSSICIQRCQSTKITNNNNLNTKSITNNILQQSDENVCNDDGLPIQSYRHSTFRPYPIPQGDQNSFRPCRSHESLLAYSSATHTIDLDGTEKQIHSIHPSVVDVSNCFKAENTYYSCDSRERIERLIN
ncbi:unnamed protein product [Cercopithifilaria johnstoni]|uniref:Ras/Rap GTPase-activating protein SynGAP-like PH domain-containing protein n=1 Tax=Cercopithifilaria johnstoni TaxID=2874296 RepID=A0A8J2PXW5_9BILA|nr:unnamed protein product [Cercopithifilaria johnstoni]